MRLFKNKENVDTLISFLLNSSYQGKKTKQSKFTVENIQNILISHCKAPPEIALLPFN